MDLSIVIVNYNVRFFLEQCLVSVHKAIGDLAVEVFVVDNDSADGSVEMIQEKFPWVKLIANKENLGFSKANNQAIKMAQGRYVLLLNPDTIVEEETFAKSVQFMDDHPDSGGLGVKMIDGKGDFLPESKRGLPTPKVAFYKIFGLSMLFPKSKKFAKYHLGYLSEDETHEIEVLSGACMFLRKEVLDKIGLLDETFFMYGEDIDLSYRVTQAGYKNYYFPETQIIHYKGESTKKSSINYVIVFYNAMVIFARKHFSDKNARSFSVLINIAIYFRAFTAILSRFLQKIALPLLDISFLFMGMLLIKSYYETSVKSTDGSFYPPELILYGFPLIIAVIVICIGIYGGYKGSGNLSRSVKGVLLGIVVLFVAYALLDEQYRFSRAMMIMFSSYALLVVPALRILLHVLNIYPLEFNPKKRVAIVGYEEETNRVANFLLNAYLETETITRVLPADAADEQQKLKFEGKLYQLVDLIDMHSLNEVIFCSKDLDFNKIFALMNTIKEFELTFKIAPAGANFIIGSDSLERTGEFYLLNISDIARRKSLRLKRLFDLLFSTTILLLSPLLLVIQRNKGTFLKNIFGVLGGKITWVGTDSTPDIEQGVIKHGVVTYPFLTDPKKHNERQISYLLKYSMIDDLRIMAGNLTRMGG